MLRTTALAAIISTGVALEGCQSIREATGAAKLPPDEFTVLTKAPLVIPPDFNLRPPQPGVASRGEVDADQQGQAALFAPSQTEQAAMLGESYSDGEKLILTRSNALGVDPSVRRSVNTDVGQEDLGPAFSQKVLYEGATPKAPARTAAAPPPPPPPRRGVLGYLFGGSSTSSPPTAPNGVLYEGTGAPPPAAPPLVAVAREPEPQPVFAPAPAVVPANPAVESTAAIPAAPLTPIAGDALPLQAPNALPPVDISAANPPSAQAQEVTSSIAPLNNPPPPALAPQVAPPAPPPVAALNAPQSQPAPARTEPKNLYQYLFGTPGAAAPSSSAQVAVARPQPVPQAQPQRAPALAAAPQPTQARAEPKNLYQYLFGSTASAATLPPTQVPAVQPQPVAQAQPQPAPTPQAQPAAAAQQPPQSQPEEDKAWYDRIFGRRRAY